MLCQQLRSGQRSSIKSNEEGILDLHYIQEPSGYLLEALEKDVNVMETWKRDQIFESLDLLFEAARMNDVQYVL